MASVPSSPSTSLKESVPKLLPDPNKDWREKTKKNRSTSPSIAQRSTQTGEPANGVNTPRRPSVGFSALRGPVRLRPTTNVNGLNGRRKQQIIIPMVKKKNSSASQDTSTKSRRKKEPKIIRPPKEASP